MDKIGILDPEGNNKNPLTIGPKKYFENHHEDFIYI